MTLLSSTNRGKEMQKYELVTDDSIEWMGRTLSPVNEFGEMR